MGPRATRSRTTRAAAEPQQISSPPTTPVVTAHPKPRGKEQATPKSVKKETSASPQNASSTPVTGQKRTRAASEEEEEKFLDELPHNLGPIATPDASDEASAPVKKRPRRAAKPKKAAAKVKTEPEVTDSKVDHVITPDFTDEAAEAQAEDAAPPKKRARRAAKPVKAEVGSEDVDEKTSTPAAAKSAKPKAKKDKYGFMPGQSPYPDYPRPTTEECYEVNRVLSKVHGTVKAPDVIPVPSVEVAGCGEVPSVLDALVRTRLSAATTGANSSRAFQGLVKRFGLLTEGVGKGSVDWNKVRLAPQSELFKAIESGGLANAKSKDIKSILDMVYEENQARKVAFKKESEDKAATGPAGSENEPAETKKEEIAKAENDILSLDHYHLMETNEATVALTKFPGIGMKTASCVTLFCLRRPSFAVDTHVFRLVQYLGWVPSPEEVKKGEPKVSRNTAYTHCEARVPDDLKYSLHQLFIKHGKTCPRCRAATSTSSEAWAKGCPIEHLVKRYGAKKGGSVVDAPKRPSKETAGKSAKGDARATPKKAGKKAKKVEESEEEEEEDEEPLSELSDVESELELSDAESELSEPSSDMEED